MPRRLLNHTAGLTVHGFADYEQSARLPSLVEVLEGKNQDDGAVDIGWEPGSIMKYSGGGYVIAQMIIEDVSGEPFAAFMEREVAKPLGLPSLGWVWTPELERRAPTPVRWRRETSGLSPVGQSGDRQREWRSADFARFVAATVSGPGGARSDACSAGMTAPGSQAFGPGTAARRFQLPVPRPSSPRSEDRLRLAINEVVHHDDVMPPVVVGSREGIAGADADERDACLVEQHPNEGKARLAFRRGHFRPVKEMAVPP